MNTNTTNHCLSTVYYPTAEDRLRWSTDFGKIVKCEYCKSHQFLKSLKCENCGAGLRRESEVDTRRTIEKWNNILG